jgi:hypothetical protein
MILGSFWRNSMRNSVEMEIQVSHQAIETISISFAARFLRGDKFLNFSSHAKSLCLAFMTPRDVFVRCFVEGGIIYLVFA